MVSEILWQPSVARQKNSNLYRFLEFVAARHESARIIDWQSLYQWSVEQPADFWDSLWQFANIIGDRGNGQTLVAADRMADCKWYPQAQLNYAENLLWRKDTAAALISLQEDGSRRVISYAQLNQLAAALALALKQLGIQSGDRVAAVMPNIPETIVVYLAAASIGAVFTSCSPDFAESAIVSRFGQTAPKVLFFCTGYSYNGKRYDLAGPAAAIAEQLPSVQILATVPANWQTADEIAAKVAAAAGGSAPTGRVRQFSWSQLLQQGEGAQPDYLRLPFDHPLCILYTSGTTGAPKCIVHGAGGTLLQHRKEQLLHTDLKADDIFHYFTTCGWMMWNWQVSALAAGATLVLYDGSPAWPQPHFLIEMARREKIAVFGTSARYLANLQQIKWSGAMPHLNTLLATGSPLSAECFRYLYRNIDADFCLASISGGTDIISCFALGNPLLPVRAGQLQCPGLGMDVQVFDNSGNPVVGQKGELVCRRPFPSMPVGFWNDPDGRRYRDSYFKRFDGVWSHGDYAELTGAGGLIIYGRTDAVLNPGGVRIGTAEIYQALEGIEAIVDSVCIGQPWQSDMRIVLFVVLAEGELLNENLTKTICAAVRKGASPRHVPHKILAVSDIPRTHNGKLAEIAVKNTVCGLSVDNITALANPQSLRHFADRLELRQE